MREVAEISFDVLDLPLIFLNQVEANVSVTLFHSPRIHHETTLMNFHGAFTVRFDNPLSFPLLLIFNGLFPLVLSGSKAR